MDTLKENLSFVLNAILVAGIIALGIALQGRSEEKTLTTAAESSVPSQIEISSSSPIKIESVPAVQKQTTSAPPQRSARPRIIGGEYNDDDE